MIDLYLKLKIAVWIFTVAVFAIGSILAFIHRKRR